MCIGSLETSLGVRGGAVFTAGERTWLKFYVVAIKYLGFVRLSPLLLGFLLNCFITSVNNGFQTWLAVVSTLLGLHPKAKKANQASNENKLKDIKCENVCEHLLKICIFNSIWRRVRHHKENRHQSNITQKMSSDHFCPGHELGAVLSSYLEGALYKFDKSIDR